MIRLFAVDPATGKSADLIFDCLPNQIKRGIASLGTLELRLPEATYLIDFGGYANHIMMMGLLGFHWNGKGEPQSDLQWWVNALRNQGVDVRQFDRKKLSKIIYIAATVLMLLAVALIMILT